MNAGVPEEAAIPLFGDYALAAAVQQNLCLGKRSYKGVVMLDCLTGRRGSFVAGALAGSGGIADYL